MENEVWKPIPNYEGSYQISNLGRVKSFKFNRERIKKTSISNEGYRLVSLYNKNKCKTISVHQLVAMSFLNHAPCGHKLVVDHINDNKLDNRLDNLQIVTQRENACKTRGNYSSKYKGVTWDKESKKWRARIDLNGKSIHLGRFNCELAAHQAYQNKLKEISC